MCKRRYDLEDWLKMNCPKCNTKNPQWTLREYKKPHWVLVKLCGESALSTFVSIQCSNCEIEFCPDCGDTMLSEELRKSFTKVKVTPLKKFLLRSDIVNV